MKLNTIELASMLPSFMREDKNFQGICYALERQIKTINEQTNLIRLFKNIDILPEEILDELALQFNCIEYNKSYSIDVKRTLIKNCLSTHHRRGTVAAVEEIASQIFGNAEVTEWFEYGGEPYHFKVYTANVSTSDEMIEEFNRVIRETQNIRSHLEEVVAETIDLMDLFFGGYIQVNEDIHLNTVPLTEYGNMAIELSVTNGVLGFNMIPFQEQYLVFKDKETNLIYTIMTDGKGILLEECNYDDPVNELELTDSVTGESYIVYVSNGQLYYE